MVSFRWWWYTCLNKGHADIVAYKGVIIYFLRSSATGCTNQELRYSAACFSHTLVLRYGLAEIARNRFRNASALTSDIQELFRKLERKEPCKPSPEEATLQWPVSAKSLRRPLQETRVSCSSCLAVAQKSIFHTELVSYRNSHSLTCRKQWSRAARHLNFVAENPNMLTKLGFSCQSTSTNRIRLCELLQILVPVTRNPYIDIKYGGLVICHVTSQLATFRSIRPATPMSLSTFSRICV
jgi:hypothetical protein